MRDKGGVLRLWRPVLGLVALVIVLGVAVLILLPKAEAAGKQPVAFNHEAMVKAGITCLFCHTDARRSPVAGIPSVDRCMGCHRVIATDSPDEIQAIAAYWERQEPIPWVRVNQLPDFVYFSHRIHVVGAGLNCEYCHGDVGHMANALSVVTMNMGWCLDCHEQQPNVDQLRECVVCHQ
jgi:hypothetical protein